MTMKGTLDIKRASISTQNLVESHAENDLEGHLLVNNNMESSYCYFKAYSSLLSSCFRL